MNNFLGKRKNVVQREKLSTEFPVKDNKKFYNPQNAKSNLKGNIIRLDRFVS